MGRHEACPSGAARQNSCCPDTYFIRRACVLRFLTMLRSRRLFLPRQALNVEAKVVGKTDKRLPNGEARSCKIVNAFSGHIFTGSSCWNNTSFKISPHSYLLNNVMSSCNNKRALKWMNRILTLNTFHPGHLQQLLKIAIFSWSLNVTLKFLFEFSSLMSSLFTFPLLLFTTLYASCLLTCSTWTLCFSLSSPPSHHTCGWLLLQNLGVE